MNELAHRILSSGVAVNGLTESGDRPWHLRLEFQLTQPGYLKPIHGVMEEWHAGPYRWKRTWEGVEPSMNRTEWSTGPYARYAARRSADDVTHIRFDRHVARPAIDPLWRAALIPADAPMDVKIVKTDDSTLNCVSVLEPAKDASASKADPRFPTLCFDKSNHLRLATTDYLAVEFEKFEPFADRVVARRIRVMANHRLAADITVDLLEPLAPAEAAQVQPPHDALAEPVLIEPGLAAPHSIFETAAHIPLQPDGYPYRGRVLAMLIIRKDGAVKVDRPLSFAPSSDVLDAVELAVRRWKFQPYSVNGQPTEVRMVYPYLMDGKPFVPSYRQTPPPALIDPEEYLDADLSLDMQGTQQRRRRGR